MLIYVEYDNKLSSGRNTLFRTEKSYLGSKPSDKNMRKVIRTKKYMPHSGATLFLEVFHRKLRAC